MRHKLFKLSTKADFSLTCLRAKYEYFMPHIFPVIFKNVLVIFFFFIWKCHVDVCSRIRFESRLNEDDTQLGLMNLLQNNSIQFGVCVTTLLTNFRQF